MAIDQPTVLQQIVKENRKLLQDHLKNVLTIADYLFERGYFSRADYHAIDDIEDPSERCNKFLDILVSLPDDKVTDVFVDYIGKNGSKTKDGGGGVGSESSDGGAFNPSAVPRSILHEKLKLSREKFSPVDFNGKPNKLDSIVTTVIDSADFTLTQKGLEEICKQKILGNEKAMANWGIVISNMNRLEDVELLTNSSGEKSSEESVENFPKKMRLRFKGEHQTVQNYIHCINWEEIAQKCLALWKERNGTNATFFSLVGIFQHSQLIEIADWLLENKDEIQKGNFNRIHFQHQESNHTHKLFSNLYSLY